jgi:intergrase/recombinase
MRARIMDVFRKFGQYYFYRYNNDQCTDLVSKIIRRYSLNVGSTDHAKLYIVDNNYLEEKLKTLLEIQGEIGLIVKMGLYSGLREEELVYVHKRPMCSNLAACGCDKLHVVDKPNGTSVVLIQWHRGHKKCYFSIIPTDLWIAFKKLSSFAYNPIYNQHTHT